MKAYCFPTIPGTKRPAITGWQDAAELREPRPGDGVYLGRPGDHCYVALDLDPKDGKSVERMITEIELRFDVDLVDTLAQNTPRGGRHLIYKAPFALKPSVGQLAPGVDVRSGGSYVVCYETWTKEPAPLPDGLLRVIPRFKDRTRLVSNATPVNVEPSRASRRAITYLMSAAPVAVAGEHGNQTTYRVAAMVKDFGVSEADATALLAEYWNPRCEPPWSGESLQELVAHAFKYGTEPPGVRAPETKFNPVADDGEAKAPDPVEVFNAKHAHLFIKGSDVVLHERPQPDGTVAIDYMPIPSFHRLYAGQNLSIGRRARPLSELWLEWDGRRLFNGVVFKPGGCAPDEYNLWRGFSYEPAATPSHPAVDMWLEHARENVCQRDEGQLRFLLAYLAQIVQTPGRKPLTSIVFRGGKGTGKNALIERVGALFRNHSLTVADRRYLVGNFNSHLERLLLLVLDEAYWHGDKAAEGVLKGLITGNAHVIERKGAEPYTIDNYTRVVIIGNEEWLVPASRDERRFTVFDVGTGRQKDVAFFRTMREGMERGGYPHLMRFLLDYDIGDVNLDTGLETAALLDQQVASMSAFDSFWTGVLAEGRIGQFDQGWPTSPVPTAEFWRMWEKARPNQYAHPTNKMTMGRALRALGLVHTTRKLDGSVLNAYRLPPLEELRAAWSQRYKGLEWPKEQLRL